MSPLRQPFLFCRLQKSACDPDTQCEFFRGEVISPGHRNWQLKTAKYDVVCVLFCLFLVPHRGPTSPEKLWLRTEATEAARWSCPSPSPTWRTSLRSGRRTATAWSYRKTPSETHPSWYTGEGGCKVKPVTATYWFNYKVLIKLFKKKY